MRDNNASDEFSKQIEGMLNKYKYQQQNMKPNNPRKQFVDGYISAAEGFLGEYTKHQDKTKQEQEIRLKSAEEEIKKKNELKTLMEEVVHSAIEKVGVKYREPIMPSTLSGLQTQNISNTNQQQTTPGLFNPNNIVQQPSLNPTTNPNANVVAGPTNLGIKPQQQTQ